MLMLLLAACVGLDVARELCFKQGAQFGDIVGHPGGTGRRVAGIPVQTVWVLVGFVFWSVEILGWTLVLAQLPLTVAFPIMSLTYAATPLASWLLLGDIITPRRWAGIGLVTAGVAIVGSAGLS